MPDPLPSDTHRAIDAVWRIESARLIAALARIVGDVGLAEDLAQDAFVIALERWPQAGIPNNPGAWLMATAKHRAIDRIRRNAALERKVEQLGHELELRQMTEAEFDAAACRRRRSPSASCGPSARWPRRAGRSRCRPGPTARRGRPDAQRPRARAVAGACGLAILAGMLFMIIERFENDDMLPVYKRVRDAGRMIPEGLTYIDSWVEPNFGRCFQLMQCDDLRLLQQWVLGWRGAGVTFEIVPVVSSKETREVVAPFLDRA